MKAMNMDLKVKQASANDIEILDDIIQRLGYRKDQGYFQQCFDNGRDVFIGEVSGLAVGYALFNRKPGYALFQRLNIPEIQDVNVVAEARKKGVATALIQHIEALAKGESYAAIGIGVGLYAGYGAAQRLYIKMGYVPDGQGISHDRQTVEPMQAYPVDDDLCLMMTKKL